MNKPTPVKRELMDYHQMIHFIEQKYKINVRDYNNLFGSANKESLFDKYQRITGDKMPCDYPDISGKTKGRWTVVRDGKRRDATKEEYDADFKLIHEQYQRFLTWEKDNPKEQRKYLDFWHWMIENQFYDVSNGSIEYWNIKDILEAESTPDWVRDITQKVYDEFKGNLDEDGGLEVSIEW